MICEVNAKRFCNEDLSNIENYEKAATSSEQYDCHHRLEIQGDKIISKEELISQNLYYNRPASELIFLTHSEHAKLHVMNLHKDTHEKMSNTQKQLKYYNNGIINTKAFECPEGFVSGRLKYYSKGNTGMRWFTNGVIQIQCYPEECPEGFYSGKLPYSKEHNRKLSESRKELMKDPECRKKLSDANKGSKRYTNGISNITLKADEPCPKGYWRGVTKCNSSKNQLF